MSACLTCHNAKDTAVDLGHHLSPVEHLDLFFSRPVISDRASAHTVHTTSQVFLYRHNRSFHICVGL